MEIKTLLSIMREKGASDMFLRPRSVPRLRIMKRIIPLEEAGEVTIEDINAFINEISPEYAIRTFEREKDVDFAFYMEECGRFRASLFVQRNHPAIVLRCIRDIPKSFDEINLPSDVLSGLCRSERGMILLTGTTGSGKSTAIAAMLEYMNSSMNRHILTLEDPIEFVFSDNKSIFNQRSIGFDVKNYSVGLRQAILQSPDIIYIANIRDLETMRAAISAAELGVLVFATLHTNNSVESIEKIINFFPPHQSVEVRRQISLLLKGLISLRLLPRRDGQGLVPAYEIMVQSPSIIRLIRDNEIHDIPRYLEDGAIYGMCSFKQSLVKLVKSGIISRETALSSSDSKDDLALALADSQEGMNITYDT